MSTLIPLHRIYRPHVESEAYRPYGRREGVSAAEAFVPHVRASTAPAVPLSQRTDHAALKRRLGLVRCADYGTMPASTCQARWRGANGPTKQRVKIKGKATKPFADQREQDTPPLSDLKWSRCRYCETGADRCGAKVPARVVVKQWNDTCETCGDHFDPERDRQVECVRCRKDETPRADRNRSRVFGRDATVGTEGKARARAARRAAAGGTA